MKLWMTRTDDIWHSSEPTNSEDTDTRPCLVTYDNTLYCFYKSTDNRFLYMNKNENDDWTSSTVIERFNSSDNEISAALFKGKLYVVVRTDDHRAVIKSYTNGQLSTDDSHQPPGKYSNQVNLVVYKGKLYLFGLNEAYTEVHYCTSTDGNDWSDVSPVKYGEEKICSFVSPQVVTYQGLLHLLFQDGNSEYKWMKFDGNGWSYPVTVTTIAYNHSPGLVVHNGLLKALFSDKPTGDGGFDKKIHQYCFDGNCWSDPIPSTILLTSKGVAAANFEGKLYSVYLGTG